MRREQHYLVKELLRFKEAVRSKALIYLGIQIMGIGKIFLRRLRKHLFKKSQRHIKVCLLVLLSSRKTKAPLLHS
jgi:hypothetical protein